MIADPLRLNAVSRCGRESRMAQMPSERRNEADTCDGGFDTGAFRSLLVSGVFRSANCRKRRALPAIGNECVMKKARVGTTPGVRQANAVHAGIYRRRERGLLAGAVV